MISRLDWRRICWIGFLELSVFIVVLSVYLLVKHELPHGDVHRWSPVAVSVIGLTLVVTLFPLVWNFRNGKDPLEPVVILGGVFFLYYPLNAFGIVILNFDPVFPAFQLNSSRMLAPYILGLLVITLGILAFYFGYYSIQKQDTRPLVPTVPGRKPVPMYLLAVWLLSAALYLSFSVGLAPAGNAFLGLLAGWHHYVPAMFVALYYRQERDNPGGTAVLLLVVAEFLVLTAVEFQLDQVLVQFIFLTVAYNYAGPGLTYTKLGGISGITVVLFPIAAVLERLQSGSSFREALFFSGSSVDSYIQAFISRFIGSEALALIIERTPDVVKYQYGDTLLLTVYSFVPRIIWADKPSIIMCRLNNIYFSGRGSVAQTCSAMTVPGELYWNFGAGGVVVGLFCLGLVVGLLYRWFIEQITGGTHPSIAIVPYAVALTHLVKIESGVAQMFSSMVKELVFVVILFAIVTTRTDKTGRNLLTETVLERACIFPLLKSVWLPVSQLLGKASRKVSQYEIESPWYNSTARDIGVKTYHIGIHVVYRLRDITIRTLLRNRTVSWCRRFTEMARRSQTWRVLDVIRSALLNSD